MKAAFQRYWYRVPHRYKTFIRRNIFIISVVAIGLLVYLILSLPLLLRERELTIATAGKDGSFYTFGEALGEVIKKHEDVTLNVIDTTGSQDNMKRLINEKVDLALAQIDTPIDEKKQNVRAIASVFPEVFHFIMNRKIAPVEEQEKCKEQEKKDDTDEALNPLINLKEDKKLSGMRIALMPHGGGSFPVFWKLARQYGLSEFYHVQFCPNHACDAFRTFCDNAEFEWPLYYMELLKLGLLPTELLDEFEERECPPLSKDISFFREPWWVSAEDEKNKSLQFSVIEVDGKLKIYRSLFSIEREKYESELNDSIGKGEVEHKLKECFKNYGIDLSPNVEVHKGEIYYQWEIKDKESGKTYDTIYAVNRIGELNVCEYLGEVTVSEELRGELDEGQPLNNLKKVIQKVLKNECEKNAGNPCEVELSNFVIGKGAWRIHDHIQDRIYTIVENGDIFEVYEGEKVDAIFLSTSLRRKSISNLMKEGEATLLSIDQVDALKLSHPYLDPFTIPVGAYGFDQNGKPTPNKKVKTASVQAMLLTHDGVSKEIIKKITHAIYEHKVELIGRDPNAAKIGLPHSGEDLGLPLHPGAEEYYNRDEPKWYEDWEAISIIISMAIFIIGLIAAKWRNYSKKKERAGIHNREILNLIREVQSTLPDQLKDDRQKLLNIFKKAIEDLEEGNISKESFDLFAFPWEMAISAIRHRELIEILEKRAETEEKA